MKKLLPLFLLILAVTAAAQTKAPKGFTVNYDKFKDRSVVYFDGYGVGVSESFGFLHDGQTIAADQSEFYLMFTGSRASCTGFCFKSGTELILLIDGERVVAGTDSRLSDHVFFYVKRGLIERLAAAKFVEYQVGRFEGKWEEKTLSKFKTLIGLGTVK